MSKEVRGYKVFNQNWTCKGKQYSCPGKFEEDCSPVICGVGMHFCKEAVDCFNYYSFDCKNKVAEVLAYGDVIEKGDKCCTNKLKIVREIPWAELLEIVNVGKACSGLCNSGDYNSGNRNSGDWNSGDCNSGDCNSGDWNSGDWNKCSFSNGCFNTVEPKIYMFNKPSEWTYRDWLNSDARYLLNQIPGDILEYVWFENMTSEEKAAHPEAEVTGGYLKQIDNSECGFIWWHELSDYEKRIIKTIPNFDKEIFKEITGIDVEVKDE